MTLEIAGSSSPSADKGGEPEGAHAIREANARWIKGVVRPAFHQFAVQVAQRGYGPVVSTSETGCSIEIDAGDDPEKFDVCVGVAAPDSIEIVSRVPGTVCPFGTRTRDEVDGRAIRYILNGALERWLSRND